MPTYRAIGVTASLGTFELQSTLTPEIVRTMGADVNKEFERVREIYTTAERLPETPVVAPDGDRCPLQFVGVNGDIPVCAVHAGEGVLNPIIKAMERVVDEKSQEEDDKKGTLPYPSSADSSLTSLGATPSPQVISNTRDQRLENGRTTERGLVIDLELSHKSFLPDPDGKGGMRVTCKDLKIEVFINGALADVVYLPSRAATTAITTPICFSGTRVHRQMEKPWIYTPSHSSSDDPDEANEHTWHQVSNSLADEAAQRGRDRLGRLSPSAELLHALSTAVLPRHLQGGSGELAVIDIIITAGKGQKYGCDTPYILQPTRLDDEAYLVHNHLTHAAAPHLADVSESHPPPQSSPDIPLKLLRKPTTPSPSKKTTSDLAAELSLSLDPKAIKIGSYNRSNGSPGKSRRRTLAQRLSDIGKMSPDKQTKEMQRLKSEYSGGVDSEPAKKKIRIDEVLEPTPMLVTSTTAQMDDPFVDSIPPPQTEPAAPSPTKPDNLLTSPSPKKPRTPRGKAKTISPTKSGLGASRTSKMWNPKERTLGEALVECVDVVEGSCVRFASAEEAKRQVGKARGGEFREVEVVVGMRFLVL